MLTPPLIANKFIQVIKKIANNKSIQRIGQLGPGACLNENEVLNFCNYSFTSIVDSDLVVVGRLARAAYKAFPLKPRF